MMQAGDTLILATRNPGKTQEFREAFDKLGVTVRNLLDMPELAEVEETGNTFAANALLKAQAIAEATGLPALADDSGLCVDALEGAPGVYSARYAGANANDADNNAKLLRELNALPASIEATNPSDPATLSTARFICALVLYDPNGPRIVEAEGAVEGLILQAPRGTAGFGYDPLFWLPGFGRCMAELTVSEKNKISHRGKALNTLMERLSLS